MSITFTIPNAPMKTVPCRFCLETQARFRDGFVDGVLDGEWLEEGDVLEESDIKDIRCDHLCEGTMTEPEAPEVNMGNATAHSLFRLLQMPWSSVGSADISTLLQRTMVALNSDRSSEVVAPSSLEGGHMGTQIVMEGGMPTVRRMGAAMFNVGMSDERLVHQLRNLRTLAVWASENGSNTVIWA